MSDEGKEDPNSTTNPNANPNANDSPTAEQTLSARTTELLDATTSTEIIAILPKKPPIEDSTESVNAITSIVDTENGLGVDSADVADSTQPDGHVVRTPNFPLPLHNLLGSNYLSISSSIGS